MPSLSIKEVPDDLAEKLRQRAAKNHRSLQGELMAILTQAVDAPAFSPSNPQMVARQEPVYARIGPGVKVGTKTIEQVVAEIRQRWPVPHGGPPLAVDIIRKERDER